MALSAAEKTQRWRLRHPERVSLWRKKNLAVCREYCRRWRANHPNYSVEYRKRTNDHRREYLRQWRLKNPEKYKVQWKAYQKAHPELKEYARKRYLKVREHHLDLGKKWYAANKVKSSAYLKNWWSLNEGKRAEYKHSRRAKTPPSKLVLAKIKLLRFEQFCRWCCIRLMPKNREIDHIIPLFRGGEHIADNLAASCKSCNSSRRTKLVEEWLPLQTFVT